MKTAQSIVGIIWFIFSIAITVKIWSWITTFISVMTTNVVNDTFLVVIYWVGVIGMIIVIDIVIPMMLIISAYGGE